MVLCGVVSPSEALGRAVNFETLILLFSMMVICAYMVEARLFRFVSYLTLSHVHSPRRLLVAVVFVSGLLSAVLVNDTVCLMTTPLVIQCCRDAKLKPLPYLLAVCFGANAGSGGDANRQPAEHDHRHAIGTAVHPLCAGPGAAGAALFSHRDGVPAVAVSRRVSCQKGRTSDAGSRAPAFDPKLAALCLSVLVAILVGFCLGQSLAWTSLFGAATIVLLGRRTPRRLLGQVDYVLLVFFAGLFVLVYGVGKAGLAERLFVALRPPWVTAHCPQIWVFAGFTTALSQLVSNVPFVLLAGQWMPLFSDPPLTWLSMALVSTLAGNLTIVGSVANIIVLDTAGPDGRIGFFRFLRYGAVVTLLTTLGSLFLLYIERRLNLI